MLRTRVLSALLLVPAVCLVVWAGGWWFFGAILIVAGLAGYEYTQLMQRGGHKPSIFFVSAFIGLFFLDSQIPRANLLRIGLPALLMISISYQLLQRRAVKPTVDWALTVGGGLYVGWLSVHLVYLRSLPDGLAWTFFALFVTWLSDSGAYFLGSAIGRHKLAPRLSPGKTWEGIAGGFLGGAIGGVVVGAACGHWCGAIGPVLGLVMGLAIAVVSPFGDLAISMMKREMGTKDSGNLIPGHGGILDRTDSLLFVVTVTYYVAAFCGS
jgi:phosphatidate cytidylyltransferase